MTPSVFALLLAVVVSQQHVMGDSLGQLCLEADAVGTSEILRQICREYYQYNDSAYDFYEVVCTLQDSSLFPSPSSLGAMSGDVGDYDPKQNSAIFSYQQLDFICWSLIF